MKAPTEAQMKDPKWWDENAPEWAKSFGFAGIKRLPVFFNLKQYQYLYGNRSAIPIGQAQTFSLGEIKRAASRPTKQSQEWDGESTAAPGDQAKTSGGRCSVLAWDEQRNKVAVQWHDGELGVVSAEALKPIRTKEQQEREELANLLGKEVDMRATFGQMADAIIAAGWRKGEV